MRSLLPLLLLLISYSLSAQEEPLNQRDAKGKKNGKWTLYLDKNWKTLADSTGAAYYHFTYYEHGIDQYNMGYGGKINWRLETPAADALLKKPVLANGEYTWYNNKGERIFVHVFKNGEYQSYTEYFLTGAIKTNCDYTLQLFWDQPHTYTLTTCNKKGEDKTYAVASYYTFREKEKEQTTFYNEPKAGDYYLVYEDETSRPGNYNLVKVLGITADSLKLILSGTTYKKAQSFYNDLNNGLTENDPSYFKNDSVFTMVRITDNKLKWKWIKEVIRK